MCTIGLCDAKIFDRASSGDIYIHILSFVWYKFMNFVWGLTDDSFCTGNCAELQSVKKKFLNLITDRKHFVVLVGHDFRSISAIVRGLIAFFWGDLDVLGLREEISNLGCGLIDTSVISVLYTKNDLCWGDILLRSTSTPKASSERSVP